MSPIVEWNQAKVLAEVSGRVVANMERACEFVEGIAGGLVPVRSGLTKRDIDHEVEARGNVVEGRVGVLTGKEHAWYAHFVEMGTSRMTARPFLRPAVFEHGDEIVKIIQGG